MRITEIMRPQSKARKSRPVLVIMAALLLVPVAGAQMVWANGAATAKDTAMPVQGFKQLPLEGRLSSPYGARKHPITGKQSFHNGIDIAAAEGAAVKSVADGTVVFAGDRDNYHATVEVRHGAKMARYAQLGSVSVKAGDKVRAGQTLGTVGNHGTGPHLHFEVWEGDKSVDPSPLF